MLLQEEKANIYCVVHRFKYVTFKSRIPSLFFVDISVDYSSSSSMSAHMRIQRDIKSEHKVLYS